MAEVAAASLELNADVLGPVGAKAFEGSILLPGPRFPFKEPKVEVKSIADDASDTSEEVTSTTIVCEHTPVRSHLHKEAVHLRHDLQVHLRSVMKTGDDMLVRIRGIVEELDIAVHDKRLAVEQRETAERQRDEMSTRLRNVADECVTLRARLLSMSKARDRAEIDLEATRGRVLELEEETHELHKELKRLHLQISELETKFSETTHRLVETEARARHYITQVTELNIKIESLKKENSSLHDFNCKLGEEVAQSRFKIKDLSTSLEKVKQELIHATGELKGSITELKTAKDDLKKAIKARDFAVSEHDRAVKDREAAVLKAESAVLERDDARRARDQAIESKQSAEAKWVRDCILLEDSQRSVTSLRKTIESLTKERDRAVQSAADCEHMRDEAIEMFEKADVERHRLKHELTRAVKERREAELALEHAKCEIKDIQNQREILIKEKEILQSDLNKSEDAKNRAISKEAKALEDLEEAEKARIHLIEKYDELEIRYNEVDKECSVLREQLCISREREHAAIVEKELMADKLKHAEEREIKALKELKIVKGSNKDLTKHNESLKRANQQLHEEVREADKKANEANNKLAAALGKLKVAEDAKESLKKQNETLKKDKQQLQDEVQEADETAADINNQLGEALSKLKVAEDAKESLKKENEALKNGKQQLQDELKKAEEKVAKASKELDDAFAGRYEQDGYMIRNIIWGSARINDTEVYKKILKNALKGAQAEQILASNKTFGTDPNKGHLKQATIWYGVKDSSGNWKYPQAAILTDEHHAIELPIPK